MVIVRTRKESRSRGVAAVEAALVMPILLLVTLGGIRLGWFFLVSQQITNAARYGARVAIRADATTQDVEDTLLALLTKAAGANVDPDVFTVTFILNDDFDNPREDIGDETTFVDEDGNPIRIIAITVKITVPAADVDIMPMRQFWEPDNWTLGASVTMAKEGS